MIDCTYLQRAIRNRCVEEGECLIWQGAGTNDSTPRPKIWHNGASVLLRRALWVEAHGDVQKHMRIGVSCGTAMCVNPDHLRAKTKPDELKGTKRSAAFKAKVAASKRAVSDFTPELIAEIRSSSLSNVALGKQLNRRHQTIARIRNYDTWQEYSSPFAGLGAR